MIVLWVLIFVIFWLVYTRFTGGQPTRHIGFLHYAIYFFAIYLGALSVYTEEGGENAAYIISVLAYPMLSLVGLLLGSLAARPTRIEYTHIRRRPHHAILTIGAVALFLAVYAVYLSRLWPNIPLLLTFRALASLDLHVARYFATKGFGELAPGLGVLYWFPRILIDYFGIFVAVFAYYSLRGRLCRPVLLVLIVGALLVIDLMANEKYPAIKLLALLTLCIYNAHVRLRGWRGLVAGVLAVAVVVAGMGVVYTIVSGSYVSLFRMSLGEAVRTIAVDLAWPLVVLRGMIGQTRPLYMIYRIIPDRFDFFMGRTFANPYGLLPYDSVPLPYLIYESYNSTPSADLRGADPTVFFGEIYANFGLPLSLLSMVFFGFLVQFLGGQLCRRVARLPTPLNLGYFYLLMAYLGDFALGFTAPWFDERLYFFAAFYVVSMLRWRRVLPAVGSAHDSARAGA